MWLQFGRNINEERQDQDMQEWIIQIMDQFGYWGIAVLIAVENIFPPIPSEVILTFGGFMTTYTSMGAAGVILASTVGAVAGALVLYGAGYIFHADKIKGILEGRIGTLLRLKPEDVARAQAWFDRRGGKTVFFCRFIPLVRSLISIPAGMAKMKLVPFLLYTVTGTAMWNTVLVWLGVAAGASWERIAGYFDLYSKAAAAVLGLAGAAVIAGYYYKKNRKKKIDK